MSDDIGPVGVTREFRWAPGRKEFALERARKLAESGMTQEQLVEAGVLGPSMPWGDLVEVLHTVHLMKEERERLGLSLNDVAERTGMDRAQISRLENGQSNPTLHTLVKYSAGIGKRIRLVFEDIAEPAGKGTPPVTMH